MTSLTLKVSSERRCSLVPMELKLDFTEYLTTKEKENFEPSLVRMIDKATGRPVPVQFSPWKKEDPFRGTLSWIMLNEAQKELEVKVNSKRRTSCRYPEEVKMWNRGDGQLEIFINGQHVTSYVFNQAYERPFLYPVIGPDGYPVTRSIPTLGDHPHHKGISLALGDVSGEKGKPGINFWALGSIGDPRQGRVIHKRFTHLEQGPVFARLEEENVWKQNDDLEGAKRKGQVLLNELRTIIVWNVSPARIIDIRTVLSPAVDEVILNADVEKKQTAKENGPLVIRVADNMRGTVEGTIVNSEGGRTEKECWGRQARWVDYYGPVVPGDRSTA